MAPKALVAATSMPLVLSILSYGDSYGYRIIKEVERLSGGQLQWTDAMLYPVWHRMEKQGLLRSHCVRTDNGRKRKYYSITNAELARLNSERDQWLQVNQMLATLWASPTDLTKRHLTHPSEYGI